MMYLTLKIDQGGPSSVTALYVEFSFRIIVHSLCAVVPTSAVHALRTAKPRCDFLLSTMILKMSI